jgi:microcystin-dependent protein
MRYRTSRWPPRLLLLPPAAQTADRISGTAAAGSTQATFVLSEFESASTDHPAGRVNLKIDNQGGEARVVIVAAKMPARSPRRPTGLSTDKIPDADKVSRRDIPARTAITRPSPSSPAPTSPSATSSMTRA